MLPLNSGQAKNSQPTFETQKSDTIYDVLLNAGDLASVVVPANANKVLFSVTNDFYWDTATFTLPSNATFTNITQELNPALRTVTPGDTIYVRAVNNNTRIQCLFYFGSNQ